MDQTINCQLIARDQIVIPQGRHASDDLRDLMNSIVDGRLVNPITVTKDKQPEKFRLVAGRNRLEACKKLGWTEIPAHIMALDALQAEMLEIDENLIRKKLTALEYAENLKRRKEIYESLHPDTKQGGTPGKAGGGKEAKDPKSGSFVPSYAEDTAKKTGRSRSAISLATQIASHIGDDVKKQLRGTPIEDRQTDLLALARMKPEKQAHIIEVIAQKKLASIAQAKKHIKQSEHASHSYPFAPANRFFSLVYANIPWDTDPMSMDVYSMLPETIKLGIDVDALLFLWVPNQHLTDGLKLLTAWKFSYMTNLVWLQNASNGNTTSGEQHELLLVGTRGNVTQDIMQGIPSVFPSHHSKSDAVYELVECHFIKDFTPIELFAEQPQKHWDGWNVRKAWTADAVDEPEEPATSTHVPVSNGTTSNGDHPQAGKDVASAPEVPEAVVGS